MTVADGWASGQRRRVLALAIATVLLLSTLEASQLLLRARLEGWTMTVPSVLVRILASWVVLAILSVLAWQVALRVPIAPRTARGFALHALATVAFTMLHILGTTVALVAVDARHDVWRTVSYLGVAYVALDVLLYALIVGAANTWQLSRIAAQRTLAAARLSEELQRAQLDLLRRQLDPHFLFNTLASISAMALRGSGRATADALAVLSELLRETLRQDAPLLHSLEQEVAYVRRYMAIMQIRFPDAIALHVAIEPAARGALIPCQVLQPLVENAVVHGFGGGSVSGQIAITGRTEGKSLVVEVEDDGRGPPSTVQEGIGLSSLKARLQYGFGDDGHMSLTTGTAGHGTRVAIRLPLQTEAYA